MKASLKGLGGIKGMALAHGEKVGMAIVALLALFLIFKSLQQQSLDANHQPVKLEEQIRLAKSTVDEADFAKAPAEDVRYYKPVEKVSDISIPEKAYDVSIDWDRPVVPPAVLRTDPVLLAPQNLEANGGSGLLAFTNDDIRKRRELEMQQEAARKEKELQKEQDRQQKESEQGRNQRSNSATRGERVGRGGELVDPEHPNRRPIMGMARQAGIPIAGDEEIRTAYWATILAKVPIKEEYKLYRDAFENARGYVPDADVPKYLGYFVERAEVLPGHDDKQLDWQPVSVYNGRQGDPPLGSAVARQILYGGEPKSADEKGRPGVISNWAAQPEEVVDPRYLDDDGVLAFPLPPLVGHEWGADVTHSDIPLASSATASEDVAAIPQADAKTGPEKQPAKPTNAMDIFSAGSTDSVGSGRLPYSTGRGYSREGSDGRTPYGGGGHYSAMMGRGRVEYSSEGRGAANGRTGDGITPQVPCWLLRFFDFSVEPGKKYKYHVKLVMQDPNQMSATGQYVSQDLLDSKAIDRIKDKKIGPFRRTEWSEPSPTVSIPLAGNVRVASAKPALDRFNDEPTTTLLVESFGSDDQGKATQAAKEEDFKRGSVANMTKDAEVLGSQGSQPYIDLSPKFQFRTGITVLDIDGGESLAKDVKKPARILLMDPAGQLFVQSEIDDANAVLLHRDIFAEPDKHGGRSTGPAYGGPGSREGGPPAPGGFQRGFGRSER